MSKKCSICKQQLPLIEFWLYKKPGTKFLVDRQLIHYHTCRNCCLKNINPTDVQTILPLLEDMNIPYYKSIYDQYLNTTNPVGKYLARMRLGNLYDLEYKDTKFLNKEYEKSE